jgi:NAD(P)-dependent dehydrogenase (short-subunit alcohol dehydrogenase family)
MSASNAGQPTSIQRVCIVTGGSRGIGASICQVLATDHATDICVNYTSESSKSLADHVVSLCCANEGRRAISFRADVSKPDQVVKMFDAAESQLGRVTSLVNNAAVIGPRMSLLETSLADLQRTIEINVHGPFLCIQEFVRRAVAMDQAGNSNSEDVVVTTEGNGAIVNISSGSAFIGRPLAYAMTKGALNSLSSGTVEELAALGIRLNSVSPGLTKTEMVTDKLVEENMNAIPMRRAAEPREIANVVGFLLSDAASFVSGGNLRVAGGRRMGSGAQ